MIKNRNFYITYYSNKDQKLITRLGVFNDKCKEWVSKKGTNCINYWDKTADGYRTCTGQFTMRYL